MCYADQADDDDRAEDDILADGKEKMDGDMMDEERIDEDIMDEERMDEDSMDEERMDKERMDEEADVEEIEEDECEVVKSSSMRHVFEPAGIRPVSELRNPPSVIVSIITAADIRVEVPGCISDKNDTCVLGGLTRLDFHHFNFSAIKLC